MSSIKISKFDFEMQNKSYFRIVCDLIVQSTIQLFDRYTVLYSGHVSSLANDSYIPAKNWKPRAIARIADALLFWEILLISRHLSFWTFLLPKKRKKERKVIVFIWRFNWSHEPRAEVVIKGCRFVDWFLTVRYVR